MPKASKHIDQLNQAVEALMKNHDAPPPPVDPGIAALLQLAADLRDLPRDTFKTRLREQLLTGDLAGSPQVGGKALVTHEDIMQRLEELKHEPKFVPYDVRSALRGLRDRTMRFIAPMNEWILNVSAGEGPSHWEKHRGDELLYVIEGGADMKVATEDSIATTRLRKGSLFICPDGLWHKIVPHGRVEAFYATPSDTVASDSKNPPRNESTEGVRKRRAAKPPEFPAHDMNAILRDLPELKITDETTGEEAQAAVHRIGDIGERSLGVMRFSGLTPWERHGCDELVFALEGAVDLTVLTNDGPVQRRLNAGSFFVCPQGLWHRQLTRPSAAVLYGTPIATSQHSFADDPRLEE
jgi:mannose-6-phosphate isomerase-like protein (cupin superfamily)